jgi:hypothetical protein
MMMMMMMMLLMMMIIIIIIIMSNPGHQEAVAYLKTLPGIHPIRRQNDEENCEI